MGRARGEDNRLWVVYSDILEPLDLGGWPLEEAFSHLLKHIGFEPVWSQATAATLELRYVGGSKVKSPPLGTHSTPSNPTFSAVLDRSANAEWFARNRIMAQVLSEGLYGLRGQIKYQFNLDWQMADQRRRNPELFRPKEE
jgi:hypothetical protein